MGEHRSAEPKMMPEAEAAKQILIAVERMAMLYRHMANAVVSELGDEKGRELIARAIASYGSEVGERHRRRVTAAGHEASCENYLAISDLPELAWSPEYMPVVSSGGKEVKVCPLAKYWIETGTEELGRLYCYVDQAKYQAFDPESECRHLKNVLDGDDACEVVPKKKSEWARIDASASRAPKANANV